MHLKKNTRPRKSLSLVLAQKSNLFPIEFLTFFCTNISFHGSSTDPIFLDDPILWKYQDGYKTIFDNHWFWRKGHSSWRRFRPSNMENCSPWVCILGESRFKITVVEILFQKKLILKNYTSQKYEIQRNILWIILLFTEIKYKLRNETIIKIFAHCASYSSQIEEC